MWKPRARLDAGLLLPTAALLALGLVAIYSSSAVYAGRSFADPERFLRAQLLWLGLGGLLAAAAALLPGHHLQRRSGWLYMLAVGLCGAVLVPQIGHRVGGARRWLHLGPITLQPSELTKLALVIFLAAILARLVEGRGPEARPYWLPVLVAQLPVLLVLAEPDFGGAVVLEGLLVLLVLGAGLPLRILGYLAAVALPGLVYLLVSTPFRWRRLLGYLDPWAHRATVGYQATEALISIGSGGLGGMGLGDGKQKLFFLPEAHTDFVFATIGEELGFAGVFILLGAYGALIVRGTRIACRGRTAFDRFLALGLTALLGLPAVLNTWVVTGLLPTKGLPLPLVSYGGSSLVVSLVAIGLLMRIAHANGVDASPSSAASPSPASAPTPSSATATPVPQ